MLSIDANQVKARELAEMNTTLSSLFSALKNETDPFQLIDKIAEFEELTHSLGGIFPASEFSMAITLDSEKLKPEELQILKNWGLEDAPLKIMTAVSLRESTGTHGSGERDKLAEAVQTLKFSEPSRGSAHKMEIDLWGRFVGIYNKLSNNLKIHLPMPFEAVQTIEIEKGNHWRSFLSNAASSVYKNIGQRWPAFVKNQVESLEPKIDI